MTARWVLASAAGCAALALAACSGVLGLDAPTLNPCAGGCDGGGEDVTVADSAPASDTGADAQSDGAVPPDASASETSVDATDGADAAAATDGASEASPSCSPDASNAIRCGGGGYPESWCCGATPVCCQGGTGPSFTCVASEAACSGYAIKCADYNDCPGQDICCHFVAHQVCDLVSNCPNNELVCDTQTTSVCGSLNCDVPFVGDAAASSPYLGCGP